MDRDDFLRKMLEVFVKMAQLETDLKELAKALYELRDMIPDQVDDDEADHHFAQQWRELVRRLERGE